MFDAVRNNKKIVQIFLALITLPFAFFGVESYVRSVGAGDDVARVGDIKITQPQFQQAVREQQEKLRAQLGGQLDPKLLDTSEARGAILDDLISQRLLLLEAGNKGLVIGDDDLRRVRDSIDAFKVDGVFSPARAESVLRNQGLTPAGFEAQLRQDLTLQLLAGAIGQSGVTARTISDRLLALQTEKRDVAEFRFAADGYLDKVKLADGEVRKFYDDNSKQFAVPEQAKAEYLVLSMDTIGAQLTVSDAEIKSWYEEHKARFALPEERRASHILIDPEKVGKDKARSKAEDVLKAVQKNPDAFAELAKKSSDDPGSAAKGGDVGFFGHGMMDKAFEDVAFKQKVGEISGVVESSFGFHIIKVTGIQASKEKPLAEVKGEIEAELKKSASARKFAEAAESFSNVVYEQADSLKPAADKFKLAIKQSDWLGRQANPTAGPLNNEKLISALFSDDSIKNKRNTEAVEIAPNTLVAARIVEYKPVSLQSFDSVKANIENMLKRREAQALARKDGEARLEALKKGEDKLGWGGSKSVSRMDARLIPPSAVSAVFKADVSKLPAYTGVELPGAGYALFKISKLEAGGKLDDARRQTMLRQIESLEAQEEIQMYLASLRNRYKVEINKAAMEAKER